MLIFKKKHKTSLIYILEDEYNINIYICIKHTHKRMHMKLKIKKKLTTKFLFLLLFFSEEDEAYLKKLRLDFLNAKHAHTSV